MSKIESKVVNFEDAVDHYHKHLLAEHGGSVILAQPSRADSYPGMCGQWILFNIRGFMARVYPDGVVDTRYCVDAFLDRKRIDSAMSSIERIMDDALDRYGNEINDALFIVSEQMSQEHIHGFYLIMYRKYVKGLATWDGTPQRWAHYHMLQNLKLHEDVYIEDLENEKLVFDAVNEIAEEVLQLDVA